MILLHVTCKLIYKLHLYYIDLWIFDFFLSCLCTVLNCSAVIWNCITFSQHGIHFPCMDELIFVKYKFLCKVQIPKEQQRVKEHRLFLGHLNDFGVLITCPHQCRSYNVHHYLFLRDYFNHLWPKLNV